MKITDKIKSFENACAALGLNPAEELPYESPKNGRQLAANAFVKCTIIAEALNEGWKPDWSNWNQTKYYPWFDMHSENAAGGSGFSFGGYGAGTSISRVGSRLVFKSRELAEYAGKTFLAEYKDWMTFEQ